MCRPILYSRVSISKQKQGDKDGRRILTGCRMLALLFAKFVMTRYRFSESFFCLKTWPGMKKKRWQRRLNFSYWTNSICSSHMHSKNLSIVSYRMGWWTTSSNKVLNLWNLISSFLLVEVDWLSILTNSYYKRNFTSCNENPGRPSFVIISITDLNFLVSAFISSVSILDFKLLLSIELVSN